MVSKNPIWVFGAGGHAKVVIDALLEDGRFVVCGLLDDNEHLHGTQVMGFPLLGSIYPGTIRQLGVCHAVIAVGDNHHRADIARRCSGLLTWATVIHPRAHVASHVQLGEGTVILAGVIVQCDAVIGSHAILNTACSVDHESLLKDFVHVAPGAHVGGSVTLKEGAMLGIGSSILPGLSVGAWSTVGAGAVVTRSVPDGIVVVGVPARPIYRSGDHKEIPR